MTDQPEGERRRSALRRKLPELLVEGFSVALAVLLALAVDEWRENRSNLELAQRAEASIMAEVGSNRSRLEEGAAARDSLIAYLSAKRDTLEAGNEPDGIDVNVSPALLARTAWETAQVTRAIHFMDYDHVARIGRIYEFQSLFEVSEEKLVELLAGLGSLDWSEPIEAVDLLMTSLTRTDMLADNLAIVLEDVERCGFERSGCEDETASDPAPVESTPPTASGSGDASRGGNESE